MDRAVDPAPASVTGPRAAASVRHAQPATEGEQEQSKQDGQPRRSGRQRRSTARGEAEDADTELRTGSRRIAHGPGKRPRNTENGAEDDGEDDGDVSHEQRPKRPRRNRNERTVSFDEVYGGGDAEYKHAIIEYPRGSENWFIIRCDQCGVYFGANPLQGGAKHLDSEAHGYAPRKWALAVQELGIRILDCDKDKADRNNEAFHRAVEAGYVPLNERTSSGLARRARRRQGQESVDASDEGEDEEEDQALLEPHRHPHATVANSPQGRHPKGKPFEGISDPIVGRLYRACFRGDGFCAALMLPLGSFAAVGVVGDIDSMDRLKAAPKCYRRSKGHISGWADGYEDGGPKVRERRFPMMYIEESASLSFPGGLVDPPSLGWVAAKDLRPFDVSDPECRRSTRGFHNAEIFLRRARTLSTTTRTTGGPSEGGEIDSGSG